MNAVTVATLRATITLEDRELQQGLAKSRQGFKDTGREADKASRDFNKAQKEADSLGKTLSRVGSIIGAGAVLEGVRRFATESIKASSDLTESMSKVNVVFGDNAKEITEWSKTSATAMGISQQKALEMTGTFGNLFTAMKIGRSESVTMSKSLVQLGADLGSFNNVPADEALLALRAGLVGETEPLRRFGVNLNQATLEAEALRLGLRKGKEDLTAAAKAQAAYSLILQQTGTAQGDFARTSGNMAGQTKIAQAELENLKSEIGNELIPVQLQLLKTGRDLLKMFTGLPEPVQKAAITIGLTAGIMAPGITAFTQLVGLIRELRGAGAAGAGVKGLAKTVAAEAGATAAGQVAGTALAGGGGVAAGGAARTGLLGRLGGLAGRFGGPIAGAAGLAALGYAAFQNQFGPNARSPRGIPAAPTMEEVNAARAARAARTAAGAVTGAAPTAETKKELEERLKATRARTDALFETELARVKAGLEGVGEGAAVAEARAVRPLVMARIQELGKQAAEIKRTSGETDEFHKLNRERWQLVGDANQLERAAIEEVQEQQKKAIAQQREIREKQIRVANQIVEHRISLAAEDQKAAAALVEKEPLLTRLMNDAANEARAILPRMRGNTELQERYLELSEEWHKNAAEIEKLKEDAGEEQANNFKRLQDSQKQAADKMKQAKEEADRLARQQAEEKQNVASARVGLLEARLRNVPGLSEEQRRRLLIPELQKERQALMTGLPGETESERLRRLTSAAGVEGRILEAMGITGGERGGAGRGGRMGRDMPLMRTIGGGFVPPVDMRQQALSLARQTGRGRGAPIVIVIEAETRQQRQATLMRQLDVWDREVFP